MFQRWHDLLFAHWPAPPQELRPLVPGVLPLDLYGGKAWIAVTPFWMSNVRPRLVPPLPGFSRFGEINVRTYVTLDGKPGVFFFSLDAAKLSAVWAARLGYRLPYFHALISVAPEGERFRYSSRRLTGPPRGQPAEFRGVYGPTAAVRHSQPGSLEHFLTERYCLYAVRGQRVWRGEIHHLPWPLQDATADFETNTMAAAAGIELPSERPLLHYARQLDVLIWWPHRVR